MCQDGAEIMKLLSAPSVLMLLIAIVIVIIVALPALFRSSTPAKPKTENEDLGIQFENVESEKRNTIAGQNKRRKSLVDPTHIARVARRANRDGNKRNPRSLPFS